MNLNSVINYFKFIEIFISIIRVISYRIIIKNRSSNDKMGRSKGRDNDDLPVNTDNIIN